MSPRIVRRSAIVAGIVLIAVPTAWLLARKAPAASESTLVATVKRGDFRVTVTTTGELRARSSSRSPGRPTRSRRNVYQTKIASHRARGHGREGGRSRRRARPVGRAATKVADVTLDLQKAQAEYTAGQLDSTLNLAKAREDIRTLELALEEKKLAKEQAQYEAPTIKRQAEIDSRRRSAR